MIASKINKKIIFAIVLVISYIIISLIYTKLNNYRGKLTESLDEANSTEINKISVVLFNKSKYLINKTVDENRIVYDGLKRSELIDKINRVLNSTIANKGDVFVNHSLELGMDPYLAVAITLQETGCQWDCSYLVKACNNVGGQTGEPGCDGSIYRAYDTLNEGIIGYLDNLYYNYYAYGLTTPEEINSKYAESTEWAYKVNSYIDIIRAA